MARNPQLDDRLGDYTADARLITLSVMAALVGVISAFVALALVRLIGLFTNLAYFHRFATSLVSPAASGPGLWSLPIPVGGGLIVGLLARYGSEKIRGHGIPEAMEAILIGRSRIEARVAVLKPLSSAIAGRFRRAPRAADRQHRRRGRDRAPDASLDPHGEARPPRAPREARVRRQPAACAARRGCDGAAVGAPRDGRGAGGGLPRRITRDGDAEAARARGGGAPRGESRRSGPRGGLRGALRHPRRVGAAHARRAHEGRRLARPAAPSVALAVARPGRRLARRPPVLLVPAHHVELRPHEVRRFRARAVVLAVEAQHHRRHAAHLERRVVLLRLRNR